MNILPGNLRFGAGQPVKRLEDLRLLTGKGQFIDDKPEDGALWLHVLRSPHAHARIRSIDIDAAKEMPGIEAVYTGADLVADDIGRHRYLVITFHVHEMETVAILIHVLMLAVFDEGALDLVGGFPALGDLHAVADAAHVDLCGGRALAGVKALGLENHVEPIFEFDDIALAE